MRDSVRIICKIEIKGPNLVKGISFEGQRVLGNPKDFIDYYTNNGADEIFIQDTVASLYERSLDFDFIKNITENVNIPVIVGGGIKSIDEIKMALRSGADKVAINTFAIKNEKFLKEAINVFGSQCIVSSIEAKKLDFNNYVLFYEYGRANSDMDLIHWVEKICDIGVGEIVLTSVDKDGTMSGLDLELGNLVNSRCTMPLILSGGFHQANEIGYAFKKYGLKNFAISKSFHYNCLKDDLFVNNSINQYNQILRKSNNLDIGNKEFLKNLFYKTDSINFDTFEIARLKNELIDNSNLKIRF